MGNMILFLVRTPTHSIGQQQKTATQHFHDSLLSKEKPVQCLCSLTSLHLTSLHFTSQLSNQQSYHSTTCNGGSTTLLLCGDMVWQWQWHHGIHPCDVDQWAVGQEAAAPKNKLGGSCCSQKRLSMPFLGTITCLLNHSRNLQPPCCLLQREISTERPVLVVVVAMGLWHLGGLIPKDAASEFGISISVAHQKIKQFIKAVNNLFAIDVPCLSEELERCAAEWNENLEPLEHSMVVLVPSVDGFVTFINQKMWTTWLTATADTTSNMESTSRLLLMQTYSSFILAPLDQEWPMTSEHSTIALSFDSGLTVHQTSASSLEKMLVQFLMQFSFRSVEQWNTSPLIEHKTSALVNSGSVVRWLIGKVEIIGKHINSLFLK